MLRFDEGNSRFNFRSVAVIVHEGYVLLHKNIDDDFWALPGGRVEFFENSDVCVERELMEELGVQSRVLRHLWYVESFFEYMGRHYHEIANYFLVELLETNVFSITDVFSGIEEDTNLIFKWFALSELHKMSIKPEFLAEGLQHLPEAVEFIKINEIANN